MSGDRFDEALGSGRGPQRPPTFATGTMSTGDRLELARLSAGLDAGRLQEVVELLTQHGPQLRAPFPDLRQVDRPAFEGPRVALVDAVNDALTEHILRDLLAPERYGQTLLAFYEQLGGAAAVTLAGPHLSTAHLPSYPLDYAIAEQFSPGAAANPERYVAHLRQAAAVQTALMTLEVCAQQDAGEQLVMAVAGPVYGWMKVVAIEGAGSHSVAQQLAAWPGWTSVFSDLVPTKPETASPRQDDLERARHHLQDGFARRIWSGQA